jgi:hypothetical protein
MEVSSCNPLKSPSFLANQESRKHIFTDLQPYVCVESDCTDFERLYETCHEWIQHVHYNHWMKWECTRGCNIYFSQEKDLTHHLETSHAELAKNHINSLVALSARPGSGFRALTCPICIEELTTIDQYRDHIGWHQEQLALLTVPVEEDNGTPKKITTVAEPPKKNRVRSRPSLSTGYETSPKKVRVAKAKPADLRWTCVRSSKELHFDDYTDLSSRIVPVPFIAGSMIPRVHCAAPDTFYN